MNTTYFKNLIMGNIFKTKTSPAIPSKYYIGLSSTAPALNGTNVTEPSGKGYSRVELTSLSTPQNGVITNSNDILFPESTADWFGADNPATHYVIYDSKTGGNLLMYDALTSPRFIQENTIATIVSPSLVIKLID